MPCGLLKLNSCGVGSSKLMPQSVQAKWDERTMSPGCVPAARRLRGCCGEPVRSSSPSVRRVLARLGRLGSLGSSVLPHRRCVATMRLPLPIAERRVDRFGQPAADRSGPPSADR